MDRSAVARAVAPLLEAGRTDARERQRLLALGTSRFAAAAGLVTLDVPRVRDRPAKVGRPDFAEEVRAEAWLAFLLPAAAIGDDRGRRLFEEVVIPLSGMLGECVDDYDAAANRIASCLVDRVDDEVVDILCEEIGLAAAARAAHPALLEAATALSALSAVEAAVGDRTGNGTEALAI